MVLTIYIQRKPRQLSGTVGLDISYGFSRKKILGAGMLFMDEGAAVLFVEAMKRMPATLVKVQVEDVV